MSIGHYKKVISLFSDPVLVVTGSGRILALNANAATLFGNLQLETYAVYLHDLVVSEDNQLDSSLRLGSRTRSPLIVGPITIKVQDKPRTFTMRAGVLEPRQEDTDAILLLRLTPKEETVMRFQALKERIDVLNEEMNKRLRVEHDLRAQRRWLEITLASIGDAVITTDSNNLITFMNPVAESMSRWTAREAVGKPLHEIFVVVNEHTGKLVENPSEKALRTGKVVALANHSELVTKGGNKLSIEDTAAPIFIDDKIEGAILVFHDVSDRRVLEKQLIDRADRLELANRRKSEFLTMLAHELRGPLAPISNAIEIIRLQSSNQPVLSRPHDIIARQVEHLKRLIDDMLDVSRITHGKMQINKTQMDLASLVSQACSDYESQFYDSHISLKSSVPSSAVWIEADAHRIIQVIQNLLVNALKFTPAGGSVTVKLLVKGQTAVLQIVDTGVGIDKAILSDVFEPFSQATQNLDRSIGGLGLGLSLVKGIVDLHDGHVSVTSAGSHKGATFTIKLPLSKRKGLFEENVSSIRPLSFKYVVLIIEDDKDTADTMSQLLELLGHRVEICHAGLDGIKRATALNPDVIFCDIGLPGLDGFAVAEWLRQNPVTEKTPLIALTGYGNTDSVNKARKAGFDHHITKPASLDEFQRVLNIKYSKPGHGDRGIENSYEVGKS